MTAFHQGKETKSRSLCGKLFQVDIPQGISISLETISFETISILFSSLSIETVPILFSAQISSFEQFKTLEKLQFLPGRIESI